MPEKTKRNETDKQTAKKNRAKIKPENHPRANDGKSVDVPKEGSYYYDDSYGYEIYNSDEDDDEN